MKIQFLGTGAADWPIKRKDGEKEYRHLSSALIDGCLLIDFGPNVLDALDNCKVKQTDIKYIINTHRHADHYNEDVLKTLIAGGAEFVPFEKNEQKEIGKYTIYSFAANHSTCDGAAHFIIDDGEKTVFYGLDGAWLLMSEVDAIKRFKPDVAVLDATVGDIVGDYRIFEHNNLNMVSEIKKSLEQYVGKFYISHMARTLHTNHEALAKRMERDGVFVAYDGLTINI